MTGRHEFEVPDGVKGRLDQFLSARLPDHSRSRIAAWIRQGHVTVDGRPARPSLTVAMGQRVVFEPPPPQPTGVVPQDIPLTVLHEDAAVVVIDKPAGIVVHPGAGHADGTLLNGLVHAFGELSPIGLPDRPGVVHRIDAGTSGLLVFARTEAAHHALAAQFSAHTAERVYHALVWDHGIADTGTIESLHGRHHRERRKFTGQVKTGKRAVTHWKVMERLRPCAWVEVRLETGRTHQIRVHLSEARQPLVGDALYGRRRRVDRIPRLRQLGWEFGLARQALHAAVLGFVHPTTGENVCFESPLPSDIATVLEALRCPG